MSPDLLWNAPTDPPPSSPQPGTAPATLLLAHGAGAAMDSAWMTTVAELLARRGIRVARFEFTYMAARRTGSRKPPPRAETLAQEYRDAVAAVGQESERLFIGGKSMGGRVASLVADELHTAGAIEGLVCLGYPFHPPGNPEKLRTAHLEKLQTPTLICQGTRDPFGTREDVAGYALSPTIELQWLEDGEHEFKPRTKISGFTHAQRLATAADAVAAFVARETLAPGGSAP